MLTSFKELGLVLVLYVLEVQCTKIYSKKMGLKFKILLFFQLFFTMEIFGLRYPD